MEKKKQVLAFAGSLFVLSVVSFVVLGVNLSKPVFQVESCSNHPVLSQGDVVLIEDTDFGDIDEGDNVVYDVPSRGFVVAHQVTNKSGNGLQTLGQNNEQQLPFEENVEPSQVYGTPALVLPLNGQKSCNTK